MEIGCDWKTSSFADIKVFTLSEGRRKTSEMPIARKGLAQQFAKTRLHNYQLP